LLASRDRPDRLPVAFREVRRAAHPDPGARRQIFIEIAKFAKSIDRELMIDLDL